MSTSTAPPRPADLETMCVDLAEGAAKQVRRGRRADMPVDTKSASTDLVTQVDRDTESWLRAQLGRLRPDDAILGEEAGASDGSSSNGPSDAGSGRMRWLLDPIDGTVNFVLGLPYYAVSVAAEVDGVVVAGAVANPVSRETFHAHRGGGAFLGTSRLTGPRPVELEAAVVATGFGYDRAVRERQAAVVAGLLPRIADIRRVGAASVDLCALAAGRVDGYFEAGLHEWDYAAGALIAAEAGCVVSGLRGRVPGSVMVAAARPDLAAGLFEQLERLEADRVLG
jgi:myo-inositol-1(or 4)-monophosphatase